MTAKIITSTENLPYEEWLDLRKTGIGGSDASVVCGINKYKSPVELWMEKTGKQPPQEAGESAYWGTQLESIVREEFTKRTGLDVKLTLEKTTNKTGQPYSLFNFEAVAELTPEEAENARAFGKKFMEFVKVAETEIRAAG